MTKGFTPTGTLRTCYRNSCSADVVKCISPKYSISSDEISEASRLTCFANIINLAGSRSSVQLHHFVMGCGGHCKAAAFVAVSVLKTHLRSCTFYWRMLTSLALNAMSLREVQRHLSGLRGAALCRRRPKKTS